MRIQGPGSRAQNKARTCAGYGYWFSARGTSRPFFWLLPSVQCDDSPSLNLSTDSVPPQGRVCESANHVGSRQPPGGVRPHMRGAAAAHSVRSRQVARRPSRLPKLPKRTRPVMFLWPSARAVKGNSNPSLSRFPPSPICCTCNLGDGSTHAFPVVSSALSRAQITGFRVQVLVGQSRSNLGPFQQ